MQLRHLKTLGLIALATLLMAGCSSHDGFEQPEVVDITQRFNAEGKAWLSLQINVDMATRAESFSGGNTKETDVYKATVVLFHGASGTEEKDLKVASTYDVLSKLTDDTFTPTTQIDAKKTTVLEISKTNLVATDKLYLLVIFNATPAIAADETFDAVKKKLVGIGSLTAGFAMANVVYATTSDPSTAGVKALTEVTADQIQPSENAARTAPISLYVERASAKVAVEYGVASAAQYIDGNPAITFTASDFQWALDRYNTQSRLVKYVDTSWLAYNASSKGTRMVGTTEVETGMYRINWGEDGNYEGGTGLSTALAAFPTAVSADAADAHAMGDVTYCGENTMKAANMTDQNTTSVVLRLQLNGGTGFYTVNTTGSDVIYQHDDNPDVYEEGTSASESFGKPRRSSKPSNSKTIDEYLRQWLLTNSAAVRNWVNTYAGGDARHIKIEVDNENSTSPATAATITAEQITVTQTAGSGATAFSTLETSSGLAAYIASHLTLTYYPGGYCYYRVLIKHFGDDFTPWASTGSMTSNTDTKQIYGDGTTVKENDYLGRYGVVRNNLYKLTVDHVAHVGDNNIPALNGSADDTADQRLNATLTIDGWTTNE